MFKINGDTIHVTRGDKGVIELAIDDYIFSVGDTVELRVYDKKALDKLPILKKEIEVKESSEKVEIE